MFLQQIGWVVSDPSSAEMNFLGNFTSQKTTITTMNCGQIFGQFFQPIPEQLSIQSTPAVDAF
jgi:hypothetical protein